MGDIVLVTIDALRHDYFTNTIFSTCWNTAFEDFAHFPNAYSNGVATPLSFPSIHTGYPADSTGKLDPATPTIAELHDGYSAAITNNPHLRRDRGYDRGFTSFARKPGGKSRYARIKEFAGKSDTLRKLHDAVWDTVNGIRETTSKEPPDLSPDRSQTAESVLKLLMESMASTQGFYWAHLMDPHHPYYPHKVTDSAIAARYDDNRVWEANQRLRGAALRSMNLDGDSTDLDSPTQADIELGRDIYGEIVNYVDRQLSDFFKWLQDTDRYEKSMIVIMGDHGEGFGANDVFQHDWTANPIDELVRVPLAIKYPENRHAGESFTHPVQTGDLLATLAREQDWKTDIPPNTRPFTDPEERPIVSKSNEAVRVTTADGNAIRKGETIVSRDGNLSARAEEVLKAISIPTVKSITGEIPRLGETEQDELEQRLEHLGYR